MSVISAAVAVVTADLPAGIALGGINVTLTDGASFTQTVAADLTALTASFTNVPPGTYTATALAVDTTGVAIGSATPPSNAITVAALTFPSPQTVTLSLS
jgi:hypothetical protein